jgi:hypothetical protein
VKKLSVQQTVVLRQIAAGTYRPTVVDGRTRRVLVRLALIDTTPGYPPTYTLTDAGRAAVEESRQ